MFSTMKNLLVVILVIFYTSSSHEFERVLTVNVDPGISDCFYEQATEGQTIDIEFQVIDGTRGQLDVGFLLSGPGGRILLALTRRQSGNARAVALSTGDYRFCFDNTHSTISSKTVYFDILIDNETDDSEEENGKNIDFDEEDLSHELGNNMVEVANRVATQLAKARRLQEAAAARSARDDHAAAHSLSRVTTCSAFNAAAIFTIGILQVVLLRSLFDEKSRVHGIWNKIPLIKS